METNKDCVLYWIHRETAVALEKEGYIGVTVDLERRMREHKQRRTNPHLSNAFSKYDDIVVSVLAKGKEDDIYSLESKYRPSKNIGWNIAEGGFCPPKQSAQQYKERAKLRSGKNHPFYGKKHSAESLAKMSIAKKGLKTGAKSHRFKGTVVATETLTGKQLFLEGSAEIKSHGFHKGHVGSCINGKRNSHKGYTFKRIVK